MKKYIYYISVILILIVSCTWTPKTVLPEYFRVIHIPKFENSTLQPELSELITRKVIQEFELDGRLIVSEYVSKADGILFAEIIKYNKEPITFTGSGEVDTSALTIKIKIQLKEIKIKNMLHDTYVEETIEYNAESEPVETEMEAQERIINILTDRIVSKVIEGW